MGQFDPYREEILELILRGMDNASILRTLEGNHQVTLGKSQFYNYCKALRAENSSASSGASGFDPALQAFLATLPEKLDQIWEAQGKIQRAIMETDQETKLRFQQFEQMLNSRARTAAPAPALPSRPYIPSLPSFPRYRFRLPRLSRRTVVVLALIVAGYLYWPQIYPILDKFPYKAPWFSFLEKQGVNKPLNDWWSRR
jgi:hypothetical protein